MTYKAKQKDYDADIKALGISLRGKLAVIVSDFLEIECSPSQDMSPKEAGQFRKIVLDELAECLESNLQYSDKTDVPLWHKVYIVGIYYLEERKKNRKNRKISYLLRSLANLIMTVYKRQKRCKRY